MATGQPSAEETCGPAKEFRAGGAYCCTMRLAQTLFLANPQLQSSPPHQTAGWLRWFVLGTVITIILLAWFCLRGYRNNDSEGQ